jgi:hypothetical protein
VFFFESLAETAASGKGEIGHGGYSSLWFADSVPLDNARRVPGSDPCMPAATGILILQSKTGIFATWGRAASGLVFQAMFQLSFQ